MYPAVAASQVFVTVPEMDATEGEIIQQAHY